MLLSHVPAFLPAELGQLGSAIPVIDSKGQVVAASRIGLCILGSCDQVIAKNLFHYLMIYIISVRKGYVTQLIDVVLNLFLKVPSRLGGLATYLAFLGIEVDFKNLATPFT